MTKKDKRRDDAPRVVRRLGRRLDVARQVKELEADPVLELVDIENLRRSVTRGLWFFLCLGLAFTSAGVQKFMAGDATMEDPIWWACWLIEPALAGILVTVLRWEAEMLARGIEHGSGWVTGLKWTLLGSTLLMNVVSVADGSATAGMVAAHVVVPLLVFLLAEVMPVIQRTCVQARRDAATTSTNDNKQNTIETTMDGIVDDAIERPAQASPAPVRVDVEPAPAPPVQVDAEPAPAPVNLPEPPAPVVDVEPAEVESPAPVLDESAVSGLPAVMQTRALDRLRAVLAEGRRPEPSDLASLGIPAGMAGQIITRAVNGHTVSA